MAVCQIGRGREPASMLCSAANVFLGSTALWFSKDEPVDEGQPWGCRCRYIRRLAKSSTGSPVLHCHKGGMSGRGGGGRGQPPTFQAFGKQRKQGVCSACSSPTLDLSRKTFLALPFQGYPGLCRLPLEKFTFFVSKAGFPVAEVKLPDNFPSPPALHG